MNLSRIDLNLFVVMEAIYAEGGVTAASRRLNLSQPAVSHALARLRDLFGDPLFQRNGHVMSPTPLARRIIEQVRASLDGFEAALGVPEAFDPGTATRRITLAMRDAMQAAVLPELMEDLAVHAPGIDLIVVRIDRRDIERELSAGRIDLAVDVPLPLTDAVRRERLGREWMSVVVRAGHPAAGAPLDLETYLAQEHIVVSSRSRGLSAEEYELSRRNLRRRVRMRCQNYWGACAAVGRTDLMLTMPQSHARTLNVHFGNVLLPFPIETPAHDTCLYWHAGADQDAVNLWFRNRLRDAVGRAGIWSADPPAVPTGDWRELPD
ncbi:MAG: LysR family transcriptional regulator [Minwuia sp.]|uniref:LysR family transcriptional regulator n=1 Tax=Minwuia sp. TaxID=2493630 RepID=UPI003A87845C